MGRLQLPGTGFCFMSRICAYVTGGSCQFDDIKNRSIENLTVLKAIICSCCHRDEKEMMVYKALNMTQYQLRGTLKDYY